jgi:hypothetical protein
VGEGLDEWHRLRVLAYTRAPHFLQVKREFGFHSPQRRYSHFGVSAIAEVKRPIHRLVERVRTPVTLEHGFRWAKCNDGNQAQQV